MRNWRGFGQAVTAAAVLVVAMQAAPASAQTLGGACTTAAGYSADQISIVQNNVVVCNTSQVWQSLLGAPAADPNYSIAVGANSLYSVTSGTDNTALGYQAGYDLTSGAQNIIIGYYPTAGVGITTGSNNILIGQNLQDLTKTSSNQLDIGNLIFATGLSSGSTMSTGNVGIGTASPVTALQLGTGVLTLPPGSSGAPSITFAGYPSTGIYGSQYVIEFTNNGTVGGSETVNGFQTNAGYGLGGYTVMQNNGTDVLFNNNSNFNTMSFFNPITAQFTRSGVLRLAGTSVSDFNAQLNIVPNATTVKGIVVRGLASQSADLFEAQNSSGTVLVNVTSTGNVGVGTTLPTGILDVVGGTAAASTSGTNITIAAQNGGTGTTNGGSILLNVGSKSGSGTTGTVQISGAASGPAFMTTSDARIKTNITPLDNGLAGIAALEGVTYTYRPPAEREVGKELNLPVDKRQMGVIAQNVEQVFPEAVETIGTTGVKSVNYNMLMAPMIEAVKTLNRRIDALMAAVALLYAGLAVRLVLGMRRVRGAWAARIG